MTAPVWVTSSGSIGAANEGTPFTYSLIFTGTSPISVTLIAGSLPPGLILDEYGNISGTLGLRPLESLYEMVIRISNNDGFADREFSIDVLNVAPVWSDGTNLGSFAPGMEFGFNFYVNDPGGTVQTFEKISGTLPGGLSLNSFGNLYGIIDDISPLTVYEFTIRALLNGTSFIDRTFSITVDPADHSAPIWLTPSGSLGKISNGVFFTSQVIAKDLNGSPIIYSAVGLPPGITINSSTGVISGTLTSNIQIIYSFSITATSVYGATVRSFNLPANSIISYDIVWVTPAGSLGQIKEGDKSIFAVSATSTGPIVKYTITSGGLPNGLTLDISTGQIWGLAQEQVSTNTVFDFTVSAFNDTTSVNRDFSILLINNYVAGATQIYVTLYGNDKLLWLDLFSSSALVPADIYRPGDAQYGTVYSPQIMLVENLNNPSPDQVFDAISGVRRTYIDLGHVEVAQAVNNNEVIYEVLYRRIFDDSAGSAQEFIDTNVSSPQSPIVLKPGSLINVRNRLLTLGSSGGHDNLPLFMRSEQTIGNPSSIPGWFPCIIFAYVKPGTGANIAAKINAADVQLQKSFMTRARIDRIVMTPAADNSFDPQYILYDSVY